MGGILSVPGYPVLGGNRKPEEYQPFFTKDGWYFEGTRPTAGGIGKVWGMGIYPVLGGDHPFWGFPQKTSPDGCFLRVPFRGGKRGAVRVRCSWW